MTAAICIKCGEFKLGAWTACSKCGALPRTEDERALALAMTDHYFNPETLEQMAQSIREGRPPHLDSETRERIVRELRTADKTMRKWQQQAQAKTGDSDAD